MSLSVLPSSFTFFFFFNDTATTEIYTLSLHDALPIWTCSLPSVEDKSRRTDHAHPRCQSPRGNCGPGHPRRGRWPPAPTHLTACADSACRTCKGELLSLRAHSPADQRAGAVIGESPEQNHGRH